MPTDTTCRCGCGQERQRQADGRLGAWAGPGCAAQARTRTPRHPDPLAPLRGESRTEEIIASQLRSTASELQGMDLAMQQRLEEQAREQKERESRVVVTTCPDCKGRAYQEPQVTRILPDGTRETYTPLRCAKRCKFAGRLCPECRTRFEPNGAQRFCSDPCRVANWNRKTKEDVPMLQPTPVLPKPDPFDEPEFPEVARLNSTPEQLCACGCGKPVGPRGTRYASSICALKGKRREVSPEARAKMSAAAKARVQREGRVGNRILDEAQASVAVDQAGAHTELVCPCGCGLPVKPGGRLAGKNCVSRYHRGRKMGPEARANIAAGARERAARTGMVCGKPVSPQPDSAGRVQAEPQTTESFGSGGVGEMMMLQKMAQPPNPSVCSPDVTDTQALLAEIERLQSELRCWTQKRADILATDELDIGQAIHWLRRLPNDAARKRVYQLACQMSDLSEVG